MIRNKITRTAKTVVSVALTAICTAGITCALLSASRTSAAGPARAPQTEQQQQQRQQQEQQQQQKAQQQQARPSPAPIQAAEVARLVSSSSGSKPTIVCVGPRALYEAEHIPGASYHGPASTAEGLDDLKKWAQDLPKSANIILYCGCCPLSTCPNVRPAIAALKAMGFTHLSVVWLPTDFKTDWTAKGYPVEKGR